MAGKKHASVKGVTFAAGIMSGTSLDGIDGVVLRIRGHGAGARFTLVASLRRTFPRGLKEMLLRNSFPGTSRVDELTRLHHLLGRLYAETVIAVARKARVPLSALTVIGSHGQTKGKTGG